MFMHDDVRIVRGHRSWFEVRRAALTGLAILLLCISTAAADPDRGSKPNGHRELLISSWRELQDQMQTQGMDDAVGGDWSLHAFRKNRMYSAIEASGNLRLWQAMLVNDKGEFGFIALAGFHCIAAHHAAVQKEAALTMIRSLSVSNSALFCAPALKALAQDDYTDNDFRAIDSFMVGPVNRRNWALALTAIPAEVLERWFQRTKVKTLVSDQLAIAIGNLAETATNEVVKKEVKGILQQYAQIPGRPRLEYVLHGDETDANYLQCMIYCISDQTLDELDIGAIADVRPDLVRKHYAKIEPKIPKDRAEYLRRILERSK
jgi:hypothetical protein